MSQAESSGAADVSGAGGGAASANASGQQDVQGGAPGNSASGGNESGGDNGQGDGLGASFLARDDASGGDKSGKQDAGKDGKKPEGDKEADPMSVVPAKPEDYQLTFAEGISVDEGLLNGFKAKAHELGIPQGQAQQLADFYVKNAGDSAKAMQAAQMNAVKQAEEGWVAEIKARPGFQQEVVDAKRTLKEFGSEELTELMNQSRLGSHPVFFDFVVKVGKALAEPEARGRGDGGGKAKPLADRLWPDMK